MGAPRTETPTSEKFTFKGRARFLRLETPKAFEEGQKPRWEATAMCDPSDVQMKDGIRKILTEAAALAKSTYGVVPLRIKVLAHEFLGEKAPDLNDPKNKDDGIKVAFFNGNEKDEYAGYAGNFIVPMHNSKLKPGVVNRKGVTVQQGEPQYPYDGSYDLFSATLWCQVGETQRKYGKRVGINLRGVQFVADGEAFTQDQIQGEEEFQALEDEAPAEGASSSDFD